MPTDKTKNQLLETIRSLEKKLQHSLDDAGNNLNLVESLDSIIWEAKPDPLRFIYVSQKAETLLGFPAQRWIDEPGFWQSRIHHEDRDWVVAFCEKATRDKKNHSFEYRMVTASGKTIWLKDIVTVIEKNGKPERLRGMMLDITRQKIAEQALEEREKHYRTLVETAQEGISLMKLDGEIVYANATKARLFGFQPNEIVGVNGFRLIDAESVPAAQKAAKDLLNKEKINNLEVKLKRTDGSPFYGSFNLSLIKDENGNPAYIMDTLTDITGRKKAEQAHRSNEDKFKNIFLNAPLGVLHFSKDGTITDCNERIVTILGSSEKALIGLNLLTQLRNQGVINAVKTALETGSGQYSGWYKPVTGTREAFIKALFTAIYDDNGTIQSGITMVEDITQQVLSERAHRDSEERYRTLVENSPLAIVIHSEGKIKYCNNATVLLLGAKSIDQLLGKEIKNFLHPEYREAVQSRIERLYKEKTPIDTVEEKLIRFDGRTIDVEVSARIINYDGKAASQSILQDITDRRRALEALSESEEKYRTLIEQSGDAIYLLYNRQPKLVNTKFQEMFKVSREEALDPTFDILSLVAPESRAMVDERGRRLKNGEELEPKYDFLAVDKEGRKFTVEAAVTHIQHKGIIVTQGVLRDITERKKLEDRLRQAQKMEAVGQLAGGVAHDFNNLLTVINGYCDLLMLLDLQPELHNPIKQIKNASERATQLTSQLLTFSRKQVIQPKILNLNTLISDHMKMLGRLLNENIEIVTDFDPTLADIEADSGQMEQIMMNIAINARDAMPTGGKLSISTQNVAISGSMQNDLYPGLKNGQYVRLDISDTGIGMSEEVQSHIFEPFFTTKERDKGTGLGLATVYGIIKQNNGNIYVNSAPGSGTTFTVFLPIVEAELQKESAAAADEKNLFGKEKVLVVEDDDVVRDVTSKTLQHYGYEVLKASNGEEALRLYRQNNESIDLVISDVVMPLMNGRELADIIHYDFPKQKILFFSGYTDSTLLNDISGNPNIGFMQKPFSHDELAVKIRSILDKS